MKKIILSVLVIVAITICSINYQQHFSDAILSKVEALTMIEGDDSGTCCYVEGVYCKIGTVTIKDNKRIESGRPCP